MGSVPKDEWGFIIYARVIGHRTAGACVKGATERGEGLLPAEACMCCGGCVLRFVLQGTGKLWVGLD